MEIIEITLWWILCHLFTMIGIKTYLIIYNQNLVRKAKIEPSTS